MEFDPIDLVSNLNRLGFHCLNDRQVRELEVIGLESMLFAHKEFLQYRILGLLHSTRITNFRSILLTYLKVWKI
jgi:hypothetical protein